MILDHRAGLYDACKRLSPTDSAYVNLPIEEAFNWSSCLQDAHFERLYLVVFRSVRRESADLSLLKEHDDRAYAAALQAGGLLRYFKGEVNEQRRECVSFCLWENREQAVTASGGGAHRRAAQLSTEMYESYVLERYELLKREGCLVFRRLEGAPPREVVGASGAPTGVSFVSSYSNSRCDESIGGNTDGNLETRPSTPRRAWATRGWYEKRPTERQRRTKDD